MTSGARPAGSRKLAINRLRERRPLDSGGRRPVPGAGTRSRSSKGARCTFLYRGEADEVLLVHRIFGLPERIPLRRLADTDLWYVVVELPERVADRVPAGGASAASTASGSTTR